MITKKGLRAWLHARRAMAAITVRGEQQLGFGWYMARMRLLHRHEWTPYTLTAG